MDDNPGIDAVELDIQDPKNIQAVAQEVIAKHPKLKVLFNDAGIVQLDDLSTGSMTLKR
jgi:uncharacterized oxidoreductase